MVKPSDIAETTVLRVQDAGPFQASEGAREDDGTSVVGGAARDPGAHVIDRRLVQEGPAERHA
jgi:hypothetical protein